MQVQLNACDKETSAGFSKTVDVSSKDDLKRELKAFYDEVPFLRWYPDHINDDDSPDVDRWLEELAQEK